MEALRSEVAAARLVPNAEASEPTRSILYQSAASLALQADEFEQAAQLIGEALAGWPTPDTRFELMCLLERVDGKLRNILLDSNEPTSASIAFRLIGSVVSYGAIPASELIQRLESIIEMLSRSAQRMMGLPYRLGGPIRKDADVYEPRVHAFSPGSFILEVELAPKDYSQLPLIPETTPAEIVSNVLDVLNFVQDGDADGARLLIPDSAYLRNFISNARTIAPDGVDVSAVEVVTLGKQVELTKRAKEIPLPETMSSMDASNPAPEVPTILEGRLVMGDISKEDRQLLAIKNSSGTKRLTAEEGLEPLVRALFGQQVRAKTVKRGGNAFLVDAEAVQLGDEES